MLQKRMVRLDNANASSVYGVSVDSRSRPPDQPDNKYDIELGRTLDRVKSLQLGSIQIPDCRYAFDTKSVLQYSEPITILPNTHLFINEEVRTLNSVNNTCVVESRVIQILLPPTLNKILNYSSSGGVDNVVTTEFDTGLQFALTYYPLVGLTPQVVGAHFPQTLMQAPMPPPYPSLAGPVLAPSTVAVNNGGYYQPDGFTDVDAGFQYVVGYLDALTSSAGDYAARHVIFEGRELCAWSYVYTPKPTLTELFTMVNAALAAKRNATDLSGTVAQVESNGGSLQVTTTAVHGLHSGDQVVMSGTSVSAANSTFFVTDVPSSTTFVVNAAYAGAVVVTAGAFFSPQRLSSNIQFGYDDLNNAVIAVGPSCKQTTSTGYVEHVYSLTSGPSNFVSLAAYLGFDSQSLYPRAVAQVPPYILRTVQLRQGNYSADELASITTVRMNPLLFHQETPAKRTLQYKLPTGTAASVVIPCGRYTATQLVAFLNSALSPAPANITVSVNESTGKFTFTQQFGLPFMLLFEGADNLFTASNLGFEPVNYSGSSSYTSPLNALQGVAGSDGGYAVNQYPSNTYWLTADPTQSHFTFDTGCPDNPQVVVRIGISDSTVCPHTAAWSPLYDCTDACDGWSASWFPGDVLYAQAPFNYGLIAQTDNCIVTTVEPHNLIDGQSVTLSCACLAGTYTMTVLSDTEFVLNCCSACGSYTGGYYASNTMPDSVFVTTQAVTAVTVAAGPGAAQYTATVTTVAPHGLVAGQFVKLFSVPDSNVEGVWEVVSVPGGNTFTAVRTSAVALAAGAGATSGYFTASTLPVGTIATMTDSTPAGTNLVTTSSAHVLKDGDYVKVTGTTGGNGVGVWQVQVVGSTEFLLLGSAYVADDTGGTYAQVSGKVADASNATPVVITSSSTLSGVSTNDVVSVLGVAGNTAANGTFVTNTVSFSQFQLVGSAGNGAFVADNNAYYLLSSAFALPSMAATNTYTVVVQSEPSMLLGGPPLLQLEPTVSIFSTLNQGSIHEALGEPSASRLIYLQPALRDVFQLFFSHPDAKAANFGFPPVSWPPSTKTLQQFYAPSFPTYSAACQCVPVSNTYQSPYCWNLSAPDYILMLLSHPCGSKDVHTHTWKKDTKPILAKLYITSPYLNISEQMLFSTFAGFQRINKVAVEFQNPDGSLVEFNGRPHSYELLFTLYEDAADATCF